MTTSDCNVRDSVFVPAGFRFLQRLVFGIRGPKRTVPGIELAGEVEAVGQDVKLFAPGDQVFGSAVAGLDAYAGYKCLPEEGGLAIKPANIPYEEAAAIPIGASTALFFLRDVARVQKGQQVLIVGASGGVGTYAVQLARYYGATVTGVCSSANEGACSDHGGAVIKDRSTVLGNWVDLGAALALGWWHHRPPRLFFISEQ